MERGDVDDEREIVDFPVLHDVTLENAAYHKLQCTTSPFVSELELEGVLHKLDGSNYVDKPLAFLGAALLLRLKVTRLRRLDLEGMPAVPIEKLVVCLQLTAALTRLVIDEVDWRDEEERLINARAARRAHLHIQRPSQLVHSQGSVAIALLPPLAQAPEDQVPTGGGRGFLGRDARDGAVADDGKPGGFPRAAAEAGHGHTGSAPCGPSDTQRA